MTVFFHDNKAIGSMKKRATVENIVSALQYLAKRDGISASKILVTTKRGDFCEPLSPSKDHKVSMGLFFAMSDEVES